MRYSKSLKTSALLAISVVVMATVADEPSKSRRLDPARWGSDHVGKAYPEYVTGDECLFCHRKIGPKWNENAHQLTIRPAARDEPAFAAIRAAQKNDKSAAKPQYLLGARRITRFLKRSKDYGKLDLLSTCFVPNASRGDNGATAAAGKLINAVSPRWDTKTFSERCAGCHATAVDAKTRSFASTSLDCFACHGDVNIKHTKDTSLVFLSSKRRDPQQVISICGQCHLRGGKSKSTGLPYPNTFVAGDNLFRDFQVDLTDKAIDSIPVIEQHIYINTRDVVIYGRTATTCLTCHDVHRQTKNTRNSNMPESVDRVMSLVPTTRN